MPRNGTKTVKDRDDKGHFIPGNPGGGRNKTPADVRKMMTDAAPEAVKLLIDTVNDNNQPRKIRIDAAKELLDRVYGKSTQPIAGIEAPKLEIVLKGDVEQFAS